MWRFQTGMWSLNSLNPNKYTDIEIYDVLIIYLKVFFCYNLIIIKISLKIFFYQFLSIIIPIISGFCILIV